MRLRESESFSKAFELHFVHRNNQRLKLEVCSEGFCPGLSCLVIAKMPQQVERFAFGMQAAVAMYSAVASCKVLFKGSHDLASVVAK